RRGLQRQAENHQPEPGQPQRTAEQTQQHRRLEGRIGPEPGSHSLLDDIRHREGAGGRHCEPERCRLERAARRWKATEIIESMSDIMTFMRTARLAAITNCSNCFAEVPPLAIEPGTGPCGLAITR